LGGSGFVNSTRLSCRFGNTIVLATYLSNSSITFVTPPHNKGVVNVEVSNNGIDYSLANVQYDCVPMSKIVSIAPRTGPASGGTKVIISIVDLAQNQLQKSTVLCRFNGRITVNAQFAVTTTNITQVTCFSPPSFKVGSSLLQIIIDGFDVSRHDSHFVYYEIPSVTEVLPKFVHEAGGVTMTIRGSNFQKTDSLFCRFGELKISRATWFAEGLLECQSPSNQPGLISVDISLNGVDYTHSQAQITYVSESKVVSITPKNGGAGGGTVIEVVGSRFLSSSALNNESIVVAPVCLFGSVQIVAYEFNMTHLKCIAPPADFPLSSESTVSFNVMNADILHSGTVDIISASNAEWSYTYTPETTILAVDPAFGPYNEATLVSINAIGFPLTDIPIFCNFEIAGLDLQIVPAQIKFGESISNTLECMTPIFNGVGIASLRLSFGKQVEDEKNKSTFTASSVQYTVHGNFQMLSISPQLGSESGGTKILINVDRGYGPATFIPLVCIFGGRSNTAAAKPNTQEQNIVHASYIGSSIVQCISHPAQMPGEITLTLSTLSTQSKSSNSLAFVYHELVTVATLTPTKIEGRGGTVVDVVGTNFINTSSLACRFGTFTQVYATFISTSRLRCTSPHVDVNTLTNGRDITNLKVNVYVTTNGVEWFQGPDIVVAYQHDTSELLSLVPSRGPSSGGTLIVLTMSKQQSENQDNEEHVNLGCRFGGQSTTTPAFVPAKRISNTILHCIAPSVSKLFKSTAPSSTRSYNVPVEVTFNGIDFTKDSVSFTYYQDPVVNAIIPKMGSELGSTSVMIEGIQFPRNCGATGVLCKFGRVQSPLPALWISSKILRCISPVHVPGNVDVSLSFNGGVD